MTPALLTLALTVAAPGPKDKPAALDLVGEWEITSYILGGKDAPPGVHVRFAADGTATFFGGPPAATHVGEYTLDEPPIVEFGYLTVTVDMTGRDHHLAVEFNDRTNTHIHDSTRLNLKTGKILRS